MSQEQTIWDFPTRLFHWSLVISVTGGILTGFYASDEWMFIHAWFGTAAFALIAFRLVWGLIGSHYSRFSTFVFTPSETRDYAVGLFKSNSDAVPVEDSPGHNPLGSWMIFALIGSLILINLSGFVVWGGEENQGPLAGIISHSVGDGFEDIHEGLATFLLFLIGGHLLGVWFESLRLRQNLAKSMLTGRKVTKSHVPEIQWYKSVLGTITLSLVVGSSLYWVGGF
jgi:cytochrome b